MVCQASVEAGDLLIEVADKRCFLFFKNTPALSLNLLYPYKLLILSKEEIVAPLLFGQPVHKKA